MKKRPFIQKSIAELEKLFRENAAEMAVIAALEHELKHRSTNRAARLMEQVRGRKAQDVVQSKAMTQVPGKQRPLRETAPASVSEALERPHAPQSLPALPSEMTREPLKPKPAVCNNPSDIVQAWTALEVLSPQGFRRPADLVGGDHRRVATLKDGGLPWELGEKSQPGKRLYYELILGTIDLGPAVEALLRVYADNRPDAPSSNRKAALASVLLDKNGVPLDDESTYAVSSFAWGVPIALQGGLARLGDWTRAEEGINRRFSEQLLKRDRNGDLAPLDGAHIRLLYSWLVAALSLDGLSIAPPAFALRRYEFYASKVPPEPTLLNSFFLDDLASARKAVLDGTAPKALRAYLGIDQPSERRDFLKDTISLRRTLSPSSTPRGRWPGPGRFPLALLQQAAVNACEDGLKETGVLGVNGPPGTGKTTLLREIVASRIVERAKVMAEYGDPARAFSDSGQSVQRNGATIRLSGLDSRLKGFEMIVASSNNKAVENVSAELPGLSAIADDAPGLRYYPSIAEHVLGREAWGMVAAVLGNSSNRYQFAQAFWRDPERSLSTHLNHAAGQPQIVSEKEEDGSIKRRTREVVLRENSPSGPAEARTRWFTARQVFRDAVAKAETLIADRQALNAILERCDALGEEIDALGRQLEDDEQALSALRTQLQPACDASASRQSELTTAEKNRMAHERRRPGFFARLFSTRTARAWQARSREIGQDLRHASDAALHAAHQLADLQRNLKGLEARVTEHGVRITEAKAELTSREAEFASRAQKLDVTVPDPTFFAQSHERVQMASLWFDKQDQRVRDRVFEAAMTLHRAFVDAAADAIRQNLSVFTETFGTRSMGTPAKDALIADLWATFFIVVPVVSTTFASVNRMFSRVPKETFGWLLIDEAGQATPQSAVGAIMRCRRAVVVGDPLQIEPVVTLPASLTQEICGQFGVDALKYNGPEGSVQTLADAASSACARFPAGSGHRDVGLPLLVHRRCDSPMFDISNQIAYAQLMVQAKSPRNEALSLGPSHWRHVSGNPGPDKFCAEEASVLEASLREMRDRGFAPDLYIVTPFVVVQDNLRQLLRDSAVLQGWVDDPGTWVFERVGTVHTVQGREAETVFFVLGAQALTQHGARAWAGGRPNLVNVAVTRAKSALYVIGNRELWKSAGAFQAMHELMK